MPIGALAIGTIASMIPALAQGIFGAVQASRAGKQFNALNANRPKYDIPQEYTDILRKYQQAQAGNMPGYETMLGQMGQAGARARGGAERGAISSTAYGQQVGDIYQKELDAIQNLGVKQAEYKTNMLDRVTGAQATMGDQKTQQWNINQNVPWQTEMNRLGEQKNAGLQNLFGGLQSGMSGLTDLMGTKYASDAFKSLYPQGGASTTGNKNPMSDMLLSILNKSTMGRV